MPVSMSAQGVWLHKHLTVPHCQTRSSREPDVGNTRLTLITGVRQKKKRRKVMLTT